MMKGGDEDMDEDILIQEEDELEEEMKEIEKEEEKEKTKEQPKKQPKKPETAQPEAVSETYEAFIQKANLGIMNTVTGETIEGFDTERDRALVQLGSIILNKLDKILIASGI